MLPQERDNLSQATAVERIHDADALPQLEVTGNSSDNCGNLGGVVEIGEEEGVVNVPEDDQPDMVGKIRQDESGFVHRRQKEIETFSRQKIRNCFVILQQSADSQRDVSKTLSKTPSFALHN